MVESSLTRRNSVPGEPPRSITSIACAEPGFAAGAEDADTASIGNTGGISIDVALDGRAKEGEDAGGTYWGGASVVCPDDESFVPHSSQNLEVSRFDVPQFGHLIITVCRQHPVALPKDDLRPLGQANVNRNYTAISRQTVMHWMRFTFLKQ
jgi:hypothetical protein